MNAIAGGGTIITAAEWMERYRRLWNDRFDRLDGLLEELKTKEKKNARKA